MEDDELVAILEDAGLSPYQAEAYVALLDLGDATATDVADACDVPDPRIYDVLRDLESKGYVETYQQDSLSARAHDPASVLEDLRSRSSQYLEAAETIEERWEQPGIRDHEVSIVRRFDTVLKRAKSVVREAQTQVKVAAHVDQFDRLRDELADAHRRGVVVHVSLWADEDGPDFPAADELAEVCSEARGRNVPSPFVLVADRDQTCFAPAERSVNEYGVLVTERALAFVFHWYFLTALWDCWEVLYETDGARSDTYVNIWYCVRDVEALLEDGATVSVTVRGREVENDRPVEISGTVSSVWYSGEATEDGREVPLSHLAGQATVTVDTGERQYEVGGWGAVIEEIEASTITIDDVRS